MDYIFVALNYLVENGQNIFFLALFAASVSGFFRFVRSYHWKMYKNLSKKRVIFAKTDKKDFDQEKKMLKNSQIIQVENSISDYSNIASIEDLQRKISCLENDSLVVLEYSENFSYYKEFLEAIYDLDLPVVIYATENIPRGGADEKVFKNSRHPYIEICNTSVRLVQVVMNLCLAHK